MLMTASQSLFITNIASAALVITIVDGVLFALDEDMCRRFGIRWDEEGKLVKKHYGRHWRKHYISLEGAFDKNPTLFTAISCGRISNGDVGYNGLNWHNHVCFIICSFCNFFHRE